MCVGARVCVHAHARVSLRTRGKEREGRGGHVHRRVRDEMSGISADGRRRAANVVGWRSSAAHGPRKVNGEGISCNVIALIVVSLPSTAVTEDGEDSAPNALTVVRVKDNGVANVLSQRIPCADGGRDVRETIRIAHPEHAVPRVGLIG